MIHYVDMPILNELIRLLEKKGATVATAESCTGGMVGMTLTSEPGSSAYYKGGIISYSNEVKHNELGVPQELLDTVGAVSEEVAEAMAKGAKMVLDTDYSISTTGIAGPGGATEEKPVGLVYIGIGAPTGYYVYKHYFEGGRNEVREQTTLSALTHLLYVLQLDLND